MRRPPDLSTSWTLSTSRTCPLGRLLLLLALVVSATAWPGVGGASEPVRIAQAEGQSILKIKANVEGATVFLDGEEVGQTPFIRMVDPGSYSLKISHPHYEDYVRSLKVVSGQAVTIEANLTSVVGAIEVVTNADPATVFLDGVEIGQTPNLVIPDVRAGSHDIRVERAGYLTYSGKVKLQPGVKVRLNVQLRSNAAKLTVVSKPEGAAVEMDGTYLGEAPLSLDTVPSGRHSLTLTLEGRSTSYRSFTVRVGDDLKLEVDLPERGSPVKVKATEPDAQVFLEGALVGTAPVKLADVAPGTYNVRVSREGFSDYVETIQVTAARGARVKASLVSEDEFEQVAFEGGRDDSEKKAWTRWWFWAIAGGVVAGGGGAGTWYYLNYPGAGVSPGDVGVPLP